MLFDALGLASKQDAKSASPDSLSPELLSKNLLVKSTYSDFVLQLYARQAVWCASIQKIMTDLVSGRSGRNSYHFRPMKTLQRQFVHELAESYDIFSESQDPEPKRSVFLKLTQTSCRPRIDLKEALAISRRVRSLEQDKAEHRQKTFALQARAKVDTSIHEKPCNAIAISDVFFGVTRDRIEAALCDLWTGKSSDAVAVIGAPQVKWINDGQFAFYGAFYRERSPMAQAELEALCDEFQRRLKDKNLAMKCNLANIDDDASVLYGEKKTSEQKKAVEGEETTSESEMTRRVENKTSIDASSFNWY